MDTLPQFHTEHCAAIQSLAAEAIPLAQALEDGFTECTVCRPAPAAIDGRARAGSWTAVPTTTPSDCRSLKIAAAQQNRDAEKIPHGQAVGDGFSACPDCRPADDRSSRHRSGRHRVASPATAQSDAGARTVWVVDGRPRYHLADCMIIKDQQPEAIPFDQAERGRLHALHHVRAERDSRLTTRGRRASAPASER